MALNKVWAHDGEKARARQVPSGTVAGTPLLINGRPAVALTDRGDATRQIIAGGVTTTRPSGGVGLASDEATVAFDGGFELAVAGVTNTQANDTPVYITSGGALNLTASGNTLFGYTDYPKGYRKQAGRAVVRIGA